MCSSTCVSDSAVTRSKHGVPSQLTPAWTARDSRCCHTCCSWEKCGMILVLPVSLSPMFAAAVIGRWGCLLRWLSIFRVPPYPDQRTSHRNTSEPIMSTPITRLTYVKLHLVDIPAIPPGVL